MADDAEREPTEAELDERYKLEGNPEEALRRLLDGAGMPPGNDAPDADNDEQERTSKPVTG